MNTERTEKFVNAIACDLEEGGFRQVSGTTLRRTLATAVRAALPLLGDIGIPASQPAELAEQQGVELPPLPEPAHESVSECGPDYFDASQMREYARASLAATGKQQVGEVDVFEAYKTWPDDLKAKLSVHDLRRMNGWAPRADVSDWRIDTSAGGPILVYKGCSVIEGEDARYILSLIHKDQSSVCSTQDGKDWHGNQVSEPHGSCEQFEAWAKSTGLEKKIYAHNGMHSHPVTRGAWIAWKYLAARHPNAALDSIYQLLGVRNEFDAGAEIARLHIAAEQEGTCIDGYQSAFYELAAMMGLTAQPISPKEVWETQMRPLVNALLLLVEACEWQEIDEHGYAPAVAVSRALAHVKGARA